MKRTAAIFALATLAGLAVASATQTAIVLAPGGSVTVTAPGQASGAQSVILNPGDSATISAPLPVFNPLDYLAAGICPDGSPPNNCASPSPMTVNTPRTWRRGDYGNGGDPDGIYQLVDAVFSATEQSVIFDWDFSRYGLAYGGAGFTPSRGDGGEVYVDDSGSVRAIATEDGGTLPVPPATFAVQYFCGVGQGGTGWFDFGTGISTGSWTSGIAGLGNYPVPNPSTCAITPAFTRWRRETLPVLFTVSGVRQTLTLDCVISEHYSGMDIASATAMEQGVWCKGWGRVWFGAYAPGPAGSPGENVMAASAPWPGPPERPDMTLQSSRLWTNVILAPGGTPERAFGWPPPGVAP